MSYLLFKFFLKILNGNIWGWNGGEKRNTYNMFE